MPTGIYKRTKEYRKIMSNAYKKHNPKTCQCICCKSKRGETKGRKLSKEHKQKISKALKGKKVSKETKEKIKRKALEQFKNGMPKQTKEKISKNNARYWLGKKRPKTGKKISKILKGRKCTEEHKKNMKKGWTKEARELRSELTTKQMKKRWKNPKERKKMSKIMKKRWRNDDYRKKILTKFLGAKFERPTNLEETFINFFKRENLPFKYVGNGKFWINRKNPDFINTNGRKICIEVCNKKEKNFRNESWKKYEEERIQHFSKCGWKCLVLWECDLKNKIGLYETIKEVMQ